MKALVFSTAYVLLCTAPRSTSIASAQGPNAAATARIEIVLVGLRSDRGQALVALFRSEKGFPNDARHAFLKRAFAIRNQRVTAIFDAVPPGPLAIAVLHDENSDFEMNTGLFGIPTEGYGASHDASSPFGPPKFENARLQLQPGQRLRMAIRVRYSARVENRHGSHAMKLTNSVPSIAKLQKREVPDHFDAIAPHYDLMQRLNPGYHKHLALSARRLAAPKHARILDLCCGTGLSTEALIEACPGAELTALDASTGMLALARQKPQLRHVHFVHGDAVDPQAAGVTGLFDAVFMAYGIRNVTDPERCLAAIMQLLSPSGRVAFHEFSVAGSRYRKWLFDAVASALIVPLGRALTGSSELFTYLRRSVDEFDSVTSFEARLRRAGFVGVHTGEVDGWQRGIVHTFVARRPG